MLITWNIMYLFIISDYNTFDDYLSDADTDTDIET
jgi:hypothetical protein